MLPAHGQLCHPGWGCQLHHRLTATPQLTEMSGCTAVFLGGHFTEEDSRSILLKNFLEELQKVRRGGAWQVTRKMYVFLCPFPFSLLLMELCGWPPPWVVVPACGRGMKLWCSVWGSLQFGQLCSVPLLSEDCQLTCTPWSQSAHSHPAPVTGMLSAVSFLRT